MSNYHAIIEDLSHGNLELEHILALHSLSTSSEIRDFEWQFHAYGQSIGLENAIISSFVEVFQESQRVDDIQEIELKLWDIWKHVIAFPEFSSIKLSLLSLITPRLCEQLYSFILRSLSQVRVIPTSTDPKPSKPFSVYMSHRTKFMHWIYFNCPHLRPILRQYLGQLLRFKGQIQSTMEGGDRYRHIPELLKLLSVIIEGFEVPLSNEDQDIMREILLPLHKPNEMVEWRDQIPIIQSFHEILVQCCMKLIDKDHTSSYIEPPMQSIFVECIVGVLSSWPSAKEANTSKEVLLLHELETLLPRTTAAEYAQIEKAWIERWSSCLNMDTMNIRTKQRALQVLKNEAVVELCINASSHIPRSNSEVDVMDNQFLSIMIPSLYSHGDLSWNPTANKMSALALKKLEKYDSKLFWAHVDVYLLSNVQSSASTSSSFMAPQGGLFASRPSMKSLPRIRSTGMPPMPGRGGLPIQTALPQPVDSMSDMSASLSTKPLRSIQKMSKGWTPASGQPPPVTVTGVAPWAMNSSTPVSIDNRMAALHKLNSSQMNVASNGQEESKSPLPNRQLLEQYIEKCLPPTEEDTYRGTDADWRMKQAAFTPTLLPSLKFHDIVFGKELGRGAFSIVKYARLILKDKPRTLWPEYAVKIVSESSIKEYNYHAAVIREMAILQMFSHPGIARLISAFRYNRSSYLVLEYAGNGDLHSHILASGALSHRYTRYVIGEVASALMSVHDYGFSFNDLKPENILITELGHIKLTDFGAARPFSVKAKEELIQSRKSLGTLRDGDWRERKNAIMAQPEEVYANDDSWIDDERLEGTPAYLPVEVIEWKQTPSTLSDSWALGCLTIFCLQGRPQYFGSAEEVLLQIQRDFHITSSINPPSSIRFDSDSSRNHHLFDDIPALTGDEDIKVRARNFILSLLSIDVSKRVSIEVSLQHEYMKVGSIRVPSCDEEDYDPSTISTEASQAIIDPQSFHLLDPLILPKGKNRSHDDKDDQLWARRQFSVLWAPMPADYAMTDTNDASKRVKLSMVGQYEMTTIEETEVERSSPFKTIG